MATISINTNNGPLEVPAKWLGQHLAVTPPVKAGAPVKTRGQWVITHAATGFSCGTVLCSQKAAIQLARDWDARFGLISTPADVKGWPHSKDWGRAIQAINCPWQVDHSSEDDAGSTETALVLAARAGIPIDQAGAAPRVFWRGQWWLPPTDGMLESWTFDSVCETPDGRTVEPDHPEAWLSILRLV